MKIDFFSRKNWHKIVMFFGYFFSCITREKDKCIHIRYVEFLYNGMVLETRLHATVFLSYIQLVMIGLLNNSKNKWQILCFRKRKMEKKRRWYEVWDICESISGSDPSLLTATRQFSPGLLLLIWPDILSFISFLSFVFFCFATMSVGKHTVPWRDSQKISSFEMSLSLESLLFTTSTT